MSGIEVSEPIKNVYRLRTAMDVFCTLIVGDRAAVLMDCGYGLDDLPGAVKKICDLPLIVVVSHEHVDHIGGGYAFEQVLMTRKAEESLMKTNIDVVKDHMRKDFTKNAWFSSEQLRPMMEYEFENLSVICAGDVLDLGGRKVEVVSLPSHTAGSIGLMCREDGLLLSADSIAPLTSLIFPDSMTPEAYADFLVETEEKYGFPRIMCSHSSGIITHEDIALYRECALKWKTLMSYTYRERYYPAIGGHIYFLGDAAAIILKA